MNGTREDFRDANRLHIANKEAGNTWIMLRDGEKLHTRCIYHENSPVWEQLNSATLAINVTKILSAETQNIGFIELVETGKGFECETLLKCTLIDSRRS
ncbi:hypothetical protein B5X24_HaOG213900 [Helicoverpa armigera]|nr:hypothetical protein B5X24_HaOG213900 [Helicoverpa armigera]